ncbi:MAG: YkgJ family cysteine cluster protein [Campylobacterales bacterium]
MYSDISFEIRFSKCGECVACCDGSKFLLIPLVLDDFADVYRFFPILFGVLDSKIRAFILLSDGHSTCPYLSKNGCEIYEHRPPGCRIYPFSPYFDDIVFDDQCDALGSGDIVAKDGFIDARFYHRRLEGFKEKFEKSLEYYKSLEDNLIEHTKVQDFTLYKYTKKPHDDYLLMHHRSLQALKKPR